MRIVRSLAFSSGRRSWRPGFFIAGLLFVSAFRVVSVSAQESRSCTGDCDDDGEVAIAEVITAVGIGQGLQSPDTCPAADRDGSGDVTIDEILAAVDSALHECPPVPSTPTSTLPPTVPPTMPPTATPTTGPDLCVDVSPVNGSAVRSMLVASGLSAPLYVAAPPGDVDRIFVVEQRGTIRIVEAGKLLSRPFLDLRSKVVSGGERGLLSLAFHPHYAENGWFFIDYTASLPETGGIVSIISRLRVSDDPNLADFASEEVVLEQVQPWPAHNGGQLLFGPGGNLYLSFGDGGQSITVQSNAQDRATWLGKVLRINVDELPYTIPPDNPFVGPDGVLDEIWAMGLRNPWRMAIDPVTDALYIGDVGESRFEEINVMPASAAGANFGWCCMEGIEPFAGRCFESASVCPAGQEGLVRPAAQYSHDEGCSVTGGFVYRGCAMPDLHGTYFYGDFCTGFVRSFVYRDGAVALPRDWTQDVAPGDGRVIDRISGFGQDAQGEIYICDQKDGEVYKIVPGA